MRVSRGVGLASIRLHHLIQSSDCVSEVDIEDRKGPRRCCGGASLRLTNSTASPYRASAWSSRSQARHVENEHRSITAIRTARACLPGHGRRAQGGGAILRCPSVRALRGPLRCAILEVFGTRLCRLFLCCTRVCIGLQALVPVRSRAENASGITVRWLTQG